VHHLGKTLILYRPDLEKAEAEELARNTTRALRKPSEPYIPKKQAATGTAPQKAKKPRQTPGGAAPADRPARRAVPSKAPGHSIPRRSGSAMSLRAGVRRSPSSGSRKR